MDPTIILIIVLAALVIVILFLNKKISELKELQKPSNEIVEWLK
jgi:predicted Holliday junction resolvase-like endonuclease